MSWPNLFVAGAAKAGTTSLWRYLDAHPDVFMSAAKEPHFFSQATPWPGFPVVHDEQAYLALFARARGERWRGEASPSYLEDERAPREISRRSPEARVVVSLRDPVERIYSGYLHFWRDGREPRPFRDLVRLAHGPHAEPERIAFLERQRYAPALERWRGLFGDRLHVVVFEELAAGVERVMREIYAFLDVDPAAAVVQPEAHNPFHVARGPLSRALLRSERLRRSGGALIPRRARPLLDRMLVQQAPKPPLDEESRAFLTAYFRDDVARTEELLGRRLPWLA